MEKQEADGTARKGFRTTAILKILQWKHILFFYFPVGHLCCWAAAAAFFAFTISTNS